MAKLYFRYGAMNSGKSTALIQVAYNYEERGQKVVLIKSSIDSKGDDSVVSRMGSRRKVDILATPKTNLSDTIKISGSKSSNISCVLVDEAQFLTPEQVDQLFNIAVIWNIPVLAYGLRTDFQTKAFPGSSRLLEIAYSIEELKTICRCGKKAIFNARKINGEFVFEGSQVAIDGEDEVEYESLCGTCYMAKKDNQ